MNRRVEHHQGETGRRGRHPNENVGMYRVGLSRQTRHAYDVNPQAQLSIPKPNDKADDFSDNREDGLLTLGLQEDFEHVRPDMGILTRRIHRTQVI